jgi:hypothetical protein
MGDLIVDGEDDEVDGDRRDRVPVELDQRWRAALRRNERRGFAALRALPLALGACTVQKTLCCCVSEAYL